jgi:hypothetical protein
MGSIAAAIPLISQGASSAQAKMPALAQFGMSLYQMRMAKRFEEQAGERPEYQIPEEVQQALTLARARASRGDMPGASMAREMQREAAATGMDMSRRAARSPAEIMAAATGISGNQMRAANELGVQTARYTDMAERDLSGQLNQMGSYRDKQFDINQFQPYMQNMAAASALRGAAMQNFMGGTSDFFGGASRGTQAAGNMAQMGQFGSFQTGQPQQPSGMLINPNQQLGNPFGIQIRQPNLTPSFSYGTTRNTFTDLNQ